MVSFLIKRIVGGFGVLISVVILITGIIYLSPVDPARLTFGQRSDNETVLQKQQQLGLDQPLSTQMRYYLTDISPIAIVPKNRIGHLKNLVLHKNIGQLFFVVKSPNFRESYQTGAPVSSLLAAVIPKTIILAICAFVFAAVFGIILGILAALFKDTFIDNSILVISTIGISVPSYVAAIFFSVCFGYILHDWTNLNMQGSIFEMNDIGDDIVVWKNLLLPAIALGIRPISIVTQLSRSSMLDVMNQQYITTAKSKGLTKTKTLGKHALRNALNPIVTSLSGWLASLLAGAFFVEKVFNYKGLGELTINALINYDIPVILASVMFICAIFIIINITTDILYTIIDPKTSIQ